jgi:hypothetical protein
MADLRDLDPATATAEEVQTTAYEVAGSWQTLEQQARILADAESGQFDLAAEALKDAYDDLPEDTSPSDALTQLQPEIAAVQSAWSSLNSKLGCAEMTPGPTPG